MRAALIRSTGWLLALIILAQVFASLPLAVNSAPQGGVIPTPHATMTAEQDHKRIMDLLHITSLRPGADGRNTQAPNAVNYDEAKANPYPNLPDPLVLKKTASESRMRRRGGASAERKSWKTLTERSMAVFPRSHRELSGS